MNEDEIPAITHSLTFKCIGSTKEARYQEVLALANLKIRKGETVQVKLKKRLITLVMQTSLHLCAKRVPIGKG